MRLLKFVPSVSSEALLLNCPAEVINGVTVTSSEAEAYSVDVAMAATTINILHNILVLFVIVGLVFADNKNYTFVCKFNQVGLLDGERERNRGGSCVSIKFADDFVGRSVERRFCGKDAVRVAD